MSTAPARPKRPASTITWVLRAAWLLVAVVLIGAILVGIIRGTFYTGPAPAPVPEHQPVPGPPPLTRPPS